MHTYVELPVKVHNACAPDHGAAGIRVVDIGDPCRPPVGGPRAAQGRGLAAAAQRRLAAEEGAHGWVGR